jgi:hypothetical protein
MTEKIELSDGNQAAITEIKDVSKFMDSIVEPFPIKGYREMLIDAQRRIDGSRHE